MRPPSVPPAELREQVVAAVRDAPKPVTFKSLGKRVKAADEALRAALESAVSDNLVYRWPDFRRSQYFWHTSPEQQAREAVLATAAAQALSKAQLSAAACRKLPGFKPQNVEPLITALVAGKQLRAVTACSSSARLLVLPDDPAAYFDAARSFVEKKIRNAGFDPAAFFAAPSPRHEKIMETPVDAAALVLDAVRSLEPVRGVPVSTLRLRNHLPHLSKAEFDSAALELRRQQEVFLSQHADPFNISREDQELLIDGRDGTYYVAIALR